MTTDAISSFMDVQRPLDEKQDAERKYEEARAAVVDAQKALADARAAVKEARTERSLARARYEDAQRAKRKPRQQNVVRRVLAAVESSPATRKQIIERSGLDATSVSTTLTRCKRVGFVNRDGDDFVGLWAITDAGREWKNSDRRMPEA